MLKNSLTQIKFVNRINYLKELCRGKKVLHLGATDSPMTKEAIQKGDFLHLHLDEVSEYLIGLDLDFSMIQWLSDNQEINNIKHGNIEKPENYPSTDFDIVIAGEIFEHLSNPGKALDCIRSTIKSSSVLVITVPNAYSIKGFLRAVIKHELIHPDHTLHHSPHTLKTLLERHGFSVNTYFSYVNGGSGIIASITNQFIRFNSQLAEGIGVICTPKEVN
jgi:2-polyprenyl-3-methyl-5-hydroxy-6-metoxy-1,4-benzoquinol methylase